MRLMPKKSFDYTAMSICSECYKEARAEEENR